MIKLQKKLRRCKKAVSDIIGNLLILAITVTLFSSVLFFVTSMPSPQEQTYADMTYDVSSVLSDGSRWVNITHAGGQPLHDYATSIALFKDDSLFKVLNISDSTTPIGSEWIAGETWTYLVTGVTEDTSLSMYILDNDKNTIVWESNLVGGDDRGRVRADHWYQGNQPVTGH